MSEIKIDKGLPIPPGSGRGKRSIYPFRQMEIGDSIFIPNKTARIIGGVWGTFAKRNPEFAFKARADSVEGVPGVRVWRIAK